MKLDMKSTNGLIVAMLAIVGIAIAFWMLALSPKRDEATKLDAKVGQLEASIALHEAEVAEGEAAREDFSNDYQELVVLGKAVPGDDDTASLLVQISHIAEKAGVEFRELELSTASGSGDAPAPAPAASAGSEPVSATEAAASLLPLGASIGPAGLAVMPYTLTFDGNFFKIADFIKEIDSLVKTSNEDVRVDGRLLTLDAFSLAADEDKGFPALEVTFAVTTYLTPPSEGETAGATPSSPGTALATPASATIGDAP
jgi:Tfp pilus assembly protein PilO